jgi:hypothetical protein
VLVDFDYYLIFDLTQRVKRKWNERAEGEYISPKRLEDLNLSPLLLSLSQSPSPMGFLRLSHHYSPLVYVIHSIGKRLISVLAKVLGFFRYPYRLV